jgi:amidophosphoribosyltransferase
MAEGLQEKCAVAGAVVDGDNAAEIVRITLGETEHRGEDYSGIKAFSHAGQLAVSEGAGRASKVHTPTSMRGLVGGLATGHNRWATSGGSDIHGQPIGPYGVAHNGTLSNTRQLDAFLRREGTRIDTLNDSEKIAAAISIFASQTSLPDAVARTFPMLEGAFSCVAMQKGKKGRDEDDTMVIWRDRNGIRPVSVAKVGNGFMAASETCVFDAVGATYLRDVEPGEMVVATHNSLTSHQLAPADPKFDMIELVYFMRKDSLWRGQRVGDIRQRFGANLAKEHPISGENVRVVGVPESAVPFGLGYVAAMKSSLAGSLLVPPQYSQAIIRSSKEKSRSFTQPTPAERRQRVLDKHGFQTDLIEGFDMVIADDSIVRDNTMPIVVEEMRKHHPRSISVLIGSPPIGFPNFQGIAVPRQSELPASFLSIEQIRKELDVDYLGYLSLAGMVAATGHPESDFDLSCFNGVYPVDIDGRERDLVVPPWLLDNELSARAA